MAYSISQELTKILSMIINSSSSDRKN